MHFSTDRKAAIGLGLAGLCVLMVWVLAYQGARRFVESSRWVSHTYEVIGELEATQSAVLDCQMAMRGYVVTGDDSFLQPFKRSRPQIALHLEHLKQLTSDNPSQQARLATLQLQIGQMLEFVQQGISSRQQKGFQDARQLLLSGRGNTAMVAIHQKLEEMKQEEQG